MEGRTSRPALVAAALGLLLVVPWGLGDVQALWRAQALANEAHRRAELGLARASAAELTRAEDLYREALEAGAEGPAPWLGLTALLRRDGRVDEAVDLQRRGVAREPRNVEMRRVLASLLQETGHPDAAARHLRAVLVLDPDDGEALHNLVVLEADARNLEEAEQLARALVDLRPDWPQAYLDLGVVLARSGDRTGAADVFRRGLEAAPGDSLLTENLRRLDISQ